MRGACECQGNSEKISFGDELALEIAIKRKKNLEGENKNLLF